MKSSISSTKWTKTRLILVKTNSFVRFLEEFMAWQFAFEINWPLAVIKYYDDIICVFCTLVQWTMSILPEIIPISQEKEEVNKKELNYMLIIYLN